MTVAGDWGRRLRNFKWTDWAAVVLTVIGIWRSVMIVWMGKDFLIKGNDWLSFLSPAAKVFHGPREPFPVEFRLYGMTEDFQRFSREVDGSFYGDLPSHETLRVHYAYVLIHPARPQSMKALSGGFCDNGPLARQIGLSARIREVVVETPKPGGPAGEKIRVKIICM